jgi:hypothetical protein
MNILPLRAMQALFLDHLRNQPNTIKQELVANGHLSNAQRMSLYQHHYHQRLCTILQDTFEKTWTYLGDEAFSTAALAFIAELPSQQANIRWYGVEFPLWLALHFPADADIADLALIDWQMRCAFDGPNAPPLRPTALSGLSSADWEKVGFRFAPTLFIAPQRYNSSKIWHALDRGLTPPIAELLPEPGWLLIWRKGWQPHFRTIQSMEYAALTQLQQGQPFAEICNGLIGQFSRAEATSVAAEYLQKWLQDELITDLTGTHLSIPSCSEG